MSLLLATACLNGFLLSRTVKNSVEQFFSGLPSVCFAEVIRDFVLPRRELSGLYNVGAAPINKYELLCLIAKTYGINVNSIPDDDSMIDRSLDLKNFPRLPGLSIQDGPCRLIQ